MSYIVKLGFCVVLQYHGWDLKDVKAIIDETN